MTDLERLLHPRSIAVVGATPRPDRYAHEPLRDLAMRLGAALLTHGLEVLELNPVLIGRHGAVALDAVARESSAARLHGVAA